MDLTLYGGYSVRLLYLPNANCQQRQHEKPNFLAYPVRLAMEAQWHRENGDQVWWGKHPEVWGDGPMITKPEGLPFLSLPHPDRIFTNAMDKRYQRNGNFKYHPGTYIQAASGCWHGKCSFCVENGQKYEVRKIQDVVDEIHECYALGFREVFDDSATFPVGNWLKEFCYTIIGQHYLGVPTLGCNMRMVDVDYKLMRIAGFRMVLFGLESANQETLDRINKGVKVEDIKYIKKAAEAGLEPHICVVFGWKWETDQDAIRTLKIVHYLLRKGYAKTAQASFINAPNHESNESQRKYVNKIYNVAYSPEFWFNQIKDIKNVDDLKYLWRKIKAGIWYR